MSNIHKIDSNIYITSDEEIKEGDSYMRIDTSLLFKSLKGSNPNIIEKYCKKIILTTDADLIKDGIQAIDDEFLEWFVKNPSCESVEVGYGWIRLTETNNEGYWVSIPDNQFEMQQEEPKQETLEEANWKVLGTKNDTFYNGAKWQQERMYSEEEVIEFAEFVATHSDKNRNNSGQMLHAKSKYDGAERTTDLFKIWFEQFKKK